jgi:hypothetical protein
MKSPVKKLIIAMIFGTLFLNAGLLSAQSNEIICCHHENNSTHANEDKERSERRQEFWEKFRKSVLPREAKPQKEVHPNEIRNEEIGNNAFGYARPQ